MTKCAQCNQPLSSGSGFCIGCGFNNTDLDARKYGVEQDAKDRIERAKVLSKLFRFIRWLPWIR